MRPDFLELGLHDVGQSAVVTGRDAFRLTSSHYTATNTLFMMKKKPPLPEGKVGLLTLFNIRITHKMVFNQLCWDFEFY